MLFNSIEYLFIFIPIVFTIYFLLNKFKFYNFSKLFLLLASLYFYGSYKWDYIPIIISSIIFNYLISHCFKLNISEIVKKYTLIFGIFGNLLMLFFFKYFNMLAEAFQNFQFFPFHTMEILLPLGISFFILQEISYIVDCYKQRVKQYNLLDFSLFVCFFPQLVAGPIVRHQEMIPQFNNLKNKVINQDNIFIGIFLITVGLLKKTVFADGFSDFITFIVDNQVYQDFYISWALGITKVLQGYFDFSGYCDLAIGSAFLFNISLPWNFNSPFKSQSIIDFWKRWNMTFMRFLNDYVYKPLCNKESNETRKNISILFTFFLLGLWQGGTIVSVLYGFVNGILVCINHLWEKLNIKMNKIVAQIITFFSIIISTQLLFTDSFSNLKRLFESMLCINAEFNEVYIQDWSIIFNLPVPHNAQINIVIFVLSLYFIFFSKNSTQLAKIYSRANNGLYTFILVLVFIYAVLSITKSTDFIYFVF